MIRTDGAGSFSPGISATIANMPCQPADFEIDAIGLVCPEPLMIVRNKVREMQPGQTVHIVATDPSTTRDFRNFCRFMGHALEELDASGPRLEFVIEKRA